MRTVTPYSSSRHKFLPLRVSRITGTCSSTTSWSGRACPRHRQGHVLQEVDRAQEAAAEQVHEEEVQEDCQLDHGGDGAGGAKAELGLTEIISHWRPNIILNIVYDYTPWVPRRFFLSVEFTPSLTNYKPIL